jgi:hypothetical protein
LEKFGEILAQMNSNEDDPPASQVRRWLLEDDTSEAACLPAISLVAWWLAIKETLRNHIHGAQPNLEINPGARFFCVASER